MDYKNIETEISGTLQLFEIPTNILDAFLTTLLDAIMKNIEA